MKDDLDHRLLEFSDKHGAVLLGMHHQLQEMGEVVEDTRKEMARYQTSGRYVEETLKQQQANLDNAVYKMQATLATELTVLSAKRDEVQKLYEKSLVLLTEHKQREEKFYRNMDRLAKAGLALGVVLILTLGVQLWMH